MSGRRFGLGLFLILGFLVLVGVALGLAWWFGEEHVAGATILEVDIDEALVDFVPADPIASLLSQDKLRMRDFVEALQAAADDDDVVALVARVAPAGMGGARIEEMRDAVLAFRKSGKPAIAYADTFGEFGPANASYYLASAFDEIYIQPSGDVGLTGLRFESPFVRGTLDKIGVTPRMAHRYEYKNAMNTLTETEYTEANREAMQELADSTYGHMIAEIAEARGLSPDALRQAVDRGPFLGQQAVDAKLVDGLLYRDEVYRRVRELARGGTGAAAAPAAGQEPPPAAAKTPAPTAATDDDDEYGHLLYLRKYWGRVDHPYAEGDHVIALVYGIGGVARGDNAYNPVTGSFTMGGESVSAALRAAADDDDVEAIVFRVDSPGGSYVASDMIWREVVRARDKGKPVVVTMGDLAGSGGYFVAMGANKIVAQPSTITASIGVFGGKMLTRDMWNKIGLTWDSVETAGHAGMWSSLEDYTPEEWDKINAWLDRVYEDFTNKVASGRHLPLARVKEIAKGRIWTGVDALRLGLVDALGGYPEALRLAREEAGIPADASVRLREFPGKRSPFEELFGKGPDNSEKRATEVAVVRALQQLGPAVKTAQRMGLLEDPATDGVLAMPEVVAEP